MKLPRRLWITSCLLCLHVPGAEPEKVEVSEARQIIPESAKRIEEQFAAHNNEARGLATRVQALLQMPAPPQPTSVRARLAEEMTSTAHFMSLGQAEINGTWPHAFEFDVDSAARQQRLWRLEADKSSPRKTETLFESWILAENVGEKEQAARHREDLLSSCREAVARRPDDARTHAMLADALMAVHEPLQSALESVDRALEIDGRNLHAQFLSARLAVLRWQNKVAGVDDGAASVTIESFILRHARQAMSDAEFEAATRQAGMLMTHLDDVEAACTDKDLLLLLRCLSTRQMLDSRLHIAAGARKHEKRDTQMLSALAAMRMQPVFRDAATLRKALRLAGDDTEVFAAILLKWAHEAAVRGLLWPSTPDAKEHQVEGVKVTRHSWQRAPDGRLVETKSDQTLAMSAEERKVFDENAALLERRLVGAAPPEAALIHETICRLDMFGITGGRLQFGSRHIIEGLRLDPVRPVLLSFVLVLAQAEWKDKAMIAAVEELLLALDPGPRHRAEAADGLDAIGRHARADELLARCCRDAPEDFSLLNQKAVFLLRGDSGEDSLKAAGELFDRIKSMPRFTSAAYTDESRLRVVHNYILFLAMQDRWDDAISITTSYQKERLMPVKDAEKLLSTLQSLRPAKKN